MKHETQKIIEKPRVNELTWWKITTAVFALLFIISLLMITTAKTKDSTIPKQPQKAYIEVSPDDDPYLGDEDSPVTIIEFSDFECQSCMQFSSEILPLIRQYYIITGKVKYVYRDLPLIESGRPWSKKAAEAAECAHQQGRFWEMHNKLFENQHIIDTLIKEVKNPEEASIPISISIQQSKRYFDIAEPISYIKQLASQIDGLSQSKFEDCLDKGKMSEEVDKDRLDAEKAGVSSTPTFFINGQMINSASPFEAFQLVIEKELFK